MAEILPFIPLGIIGSMTWSLWAVRRFYGATYKPFQGAFNATTSAVVPVYMEDPEVLLRAIESYLENKVGEVILVVDYKDTLNIENIQKRFPGTSFPDIKLIVTRDPGKRPALARGIREATGEIVILSDSDTSWAGNLLEEILKPFVDPEIAGVSARQNVESRNSYRANLRAFWQGWIWRKPWILPVSIFHATVTPYTFALGALATLYLALTHPGTQTTIFGVAFNFPLLWVILSISGRSIKGLSHLRQVPGDLSLLVIVTFLMLFVMFPVKIFSLLTMNSQGWVGTRPSPQF